MKPQAMDGSPPFDRLPLRSRRRFTLTVPGPPGTDELLATADLAAILVDVIVGSARHPRIVAVAGVHGDEREGPAALAEAWARLRPGELDGTLILVPVANASAFRAGRRTSPVDGIDLNRVFP